MSKSKFWSGSGLGSGSWFYSEFQYQTYISYVEDTHQILFGSANSFESYCVHSQDPRTYVQPARQTDRPTDGFFFFFNHAITILSLFTYSVCDEEVKNRSNTMYYKDRYMNSYCAWLRSQEIATLMWEFCSFISR